MSEPPTKPSPERGGLNTPLVVIFSFLLLFAIPALPIYLWRKQRFSGAWAAGLAVGWVALYAVVGSLLPANSENQTPSAKPAAVASSTPTPTPTPTPKPTLKPTAKPYPCADVAKNVLKNPAYVFKCQFGKKWPVTVPQGIVGCRDKSGTGVQILTFLDPDGKEWALNGTASSSGYPKIDPIWRDDGSGLDIKVDIGPLIDRASKVCD